MTECDLKNFISRSESQHLEYKLKPNFNNIKESISHITKRMHFNILKSIYAFANTEGGDLYIGINDDREIIGIDDADIEIIKSIIKRVSPKIQHKTIKLEKKERTVMRIEVKKLKRYDKPQLLDGILYYRDKKETKTVKDFSECAAIYKDQQFYLSLLQGIQSNLHKISEDNFISKDNFMAEQFFKGLKMHIDSFEKSSDIYLIKDAKDTLKEIQDTIQKINITKDKRDSVLPIRPNQMNELIKKLIEDFISMYKHIIE